MATSKTKIRRVQKANGSGQNLLNGKSAGSTMNGSYDPKKTVGRATPDATANKKALTLKAFASAYETHHRKAT